MDEVPVGIDLGTTCCCVAIYRSGKTEVIKSTETGESITPSCITFETEGRFYGKQAKNNAFLSPGACIFNMKRIIGKRFNDPIVQEYARQWPFKIINIDGFPFVEVEDGGQMVKYSPTQISSFLLKQLKKAVDEFLTRDITKAVITVPANFTNAQRKATKEAGELAGLEIIGMINEPTAAALAYGLESKMEQTILVFDFGGGTLDVAILKLSEESNFEVLASDGNMNLGGEDVDERILDHLVKEYKEKNGTDLRTNSEIICRLRQRAEEAKKSLSFGDKFTISLDCVDGPKHLKSVLTRITLEALCEDLFSKILEPVKKSMTQAHLSNEHIDRVVLVGGSSKIPKVQEILRNFFPGKILHKDINPDEAIANGAAIYANLKLGNIDLKILDIIPRSLGFRIEGGKMAVLIRKGSKFPTKASQICTTSIKSQRTVDLLVYEGESSLVKDNNFLGKLTLLGIAPNVEGLPIITVIYAYDSFGCLNVSAKDEESGKSITAAITCSYDVDL